MCEPSAEARVKVKVHHLVFRLSVFTAGECQVIAAGFTGNRFLVYKYTRMEIL